MRNTLRTDRLLFLALWGAALLAMAPAPTPVAQEKTITAGGRVRTYRLYAPRSLPKDRPSSLVLVFHGGEGNGAGVERLTGFDAVADQEGFLVAYPDGVGKHWNDGRENRDFESFREGLDDVAFVAALIDAISRDHPIDPKRIFATGMSNGGIFSHYLAARLASRIAAIAPVAGGIAELFRPNFKPAKPVSVLIIHGTDDPLVPYHGGDVARGTHGRVIDTDETVRLWTAADGCSARSSKDQLPDADPGDGCRVDRTRWTGGRNGTEVMLYTIQGGGHTWPGSSQYASRAAIGRVCRDFDATQTIWEFFQKHPRP